MWSRTFRHCARMSPVPDPAVLDPTALDPELLGAGVPCVSVLLPHAVMTKTANANRARTCTGPPYLDLSRAFDPGSSSSSTIDRVPGPLTCRNAIDVVEAAYALD